MTHKTLALIYACLLVVMAIFLGYKLPSVHFESSVLSLLPHSDSVIDEKILDTYLERLDKQIVFLVKDNSLDGKPTYNFVHDLKEHVGINQEFKSITAFFDDNTQQEFNTFLYEHKLSLIDENLRQSLENGKYQKKVLNQIYSGVSGVSATELQNDPLLLTRNIGLSLSKDNVFRIKNNLLSVQFGDDNYYFINLESALDGFNLSSSENLITTIDKIIEDTQSQYPGVEILKRGTVFYSDYAANQSKHDLTYLGSITIVGVFALIFLVFRSITPVFLTLLSVGSGLIAGMFLITLFFDSINLVIIGMCLSVVGVVCDYTIYYMTLRLASKDRESPLETIKKLKTPLLFAAGTDVIAYLIILVSPIKPLKELSLFCMGAISFAVFTVILLEPYLCFKLSHKLPKITYAFNYYLNFIKRGKVKFYILIVIVLFTAFNLQNYHVDDDPSALQTMPLHLQSQDQVIAKITHQNPTQKYVVMVSSDTEELLSINEKVRALLDSLQKAKEIVSYKALPLNSQKAQAQDIALVNKALQDYTQVRGLLELDNTNDFYQSKTTTLEDYLNSPLGLVYQNLMVKTDNCNALTLLVDGVKDGQVLQDKLSQISNSAIYMDRRSDFTKTFKHFRELINYVLIAFVIVILIVSIIRLGINKGLMAAIFTVLSVLCGLAALLMCQMSANLFTSLSMILVLGIGVNYTIFFSSKAQEKNVLMLAIITALLTTLLTIGVLVLSSVTAIVGFALTLSVGILCSFITATLLPEFFHD